MKKLILAILMAFAAKAQDPIAGPSYPYVNNIGAFATNATILATNNLMALSPYFVPGTTSIGFIGDSWTQGAINAQVSWANAGTIFQQYRWVSILATNYLGGLGINNYGISGSGTQFSTNNLWNQKTFQAQLGQNFGVSWSGPLVIMGGYNDFSGAANSEMAYYQSFMAGWDALLAQAYCTNYVTVSGYQPNGATYPVTTAGSIVNFGYPAGNPFPVGTPGTDPMKYLNATGTSNQVFTATFTNAQNLAVFYTQDNGTAWGYGAGGVFECYVNGQDVASVNTQLPGTVTYEQWGAAILRGVPAITTLTITNLSGTSRIYAIGIFPNPSALQNRSVILSTTQRTLSPNRSDHGLRLLGAAAAAAAQHWADYRMGLVDVGGYLGPQDTIQAYDTLNGFADPDHPSRSGNQKIARLFAGAKQVNAVTARAFIDSPTESFFPNLDVKILGDSGSSQPGATSLRNNAQSGFIADTLDYSSAHTLPQLFLAWYHNLLGAISVGAPTNTLPLDRVYVIATNTGNNLLTGVTVALNGYVNTSSGNTIAVSTGITGNGSPGRLIRRWSGDSSGSNTAHWTHYDGFPLTNSPVAAYEHRDGWATNSGDPSQIPVTFQEGTNNTLYLPKLANYPGNLQDGQFYYSSNSSALVLKGNGAGAWGATKIDLVGTNYGNNNWTTNASGNADLSITRSLDGKVTIFGTVTGGTQSAGAGIIQNIPNDYVPPTTVAIPGFGWGANGTVYPLFVQVYHAGYITVYGMPAVGTTVIYVTLSGTWTTF